MRSSLLLCILPAASSWACGLPLNQVCTDAYAKYALPAVDFFPGLTLDPSSVETKLVSNSTTVSEWFPTEAISYCNLTFAYSHNGLDNDLVHVTYWMPAPGTFKNRYVSNGGGGLSISAGANALPTGIIVGAVSGTTDGGFGSFATQWDAVFLEANGTINWQANYMFGYQAHHELAIIGKQLSKSFYNISDSEKVYTYYQGCSEGGREGWSQLQRFADQFDGAAIGAPAFRYGQQQVNHLYGNVAQKTLDYYPPTCELEAIVNMTISSCDVLDGKADGIVSRSDLCKLHFDFNSTIGKPYSCAASGGGGSPGGPTRRQMMQAATPAQNGTVTAKGALFARTFYEGLHDSKGRRAYISYQPGATFADANTAYNSDTGKWEVSISGLGGEWVARFLELQDVDNLSSLENVTYDTLKEWMIYGQRKYADSLQTTNPDLSEFQSAGGKIVHVHGEQDDSIPTGSSVHYYNSVRSVMFPDMSYNESVAAVDDFYRLYLVPGGAHCGTNKHQPGGPWPQTTLQTVIKWVEGGVAPDVLDATGDISWLCRWPLRPLWSGNGTSMDCVYDQESIDSWAYDFDAYKLPLY